MANSIGNKLSFPNRGTIIGVILGVLYVVYALSESGKNMFKEDTIPMIIGEVFLFFSIVLGSAVSGFIIDT